MSAGIELCSKQWKHTCELSTETRRATVPKRKNPAAVALAARRMQVMTAAERQAVARAGGLAGGHARARKLTPARRQAIARKAAAARWGKNK